MKKIVLMVLLSIPLFAQTELLMTETYSDGVYASDSLYYTYIDTVGVDDTTAAVVSKFWSPKYQYDWLTITKKDTGTTYDDTIAVKYRLPGQSEWYPVEFCRDSTWTAVTQPLPVDDASQHAYKIYIGDYHTVGFFLTNVASDTNCVSYIKLQASKKK